MVPNQRTTEEPPVSQAEKNVLRSTNETLLVVSSFATNKSIQATQEVNEDAHHVCMDSRGRLERRLILSRSIIYTRCGTFY